MPDNFSYILDGVLAGMGLPGLQQPLRDDLDFLREQGIGALISLTEEPLDRVLIEQEYNFRYLHLPVRDFTSPSLEQVRAFMAFLEKAEEEHVAAVAHCFAGRGRTGTLLACALVRRGYGAWDAIEEVRRLRPYSIESAEQEELVERYEYELKKERGEL